MLADQGYEIVICCRADRPANIEDYGEHISVQRIGKPRTGLLAPVEFAIFLLSCLLTAIRRRPSLLIGYDLQGLIAVGVIGGLLRIPFFYHLYDLYLPEEGIGGFGRILKRYESGLSSQAAALIVSSDSKAEFFLRTSNLDRRAFVVANSPPLQARIGSDLLKRRLAERGFKAAYIVYYHGSIGPGKGHIPVVRSIPYWPKGAAFVLLGVIHDQGFFDRLMHVAASLGVQNRIHYLGIVPLPELYDYTRSADLGLFMPETTASIHVYSGMAVVKLNDYMACGVPFLVSSIDALSALARETGAGCEGDISNPPQLGHIISALLEDVSARARMGDRGYQLHRDKFNLPAQYEPVLEQIRRTCKVELTR